MGELVDKTSESRPRLPSALLETSERFGEVFEERCEDSVSKMVEENTKDKEEGGSVASVCSFSFTCDEVRRA